MAAYYNENDAYCAAWLRNLISEGLIAPGDVDERDIRDVRPDELRGYTQCHFFAGIGVWSYALRLAEWPDDRPVWTGSCPCQPFSRAGRHENERSDKHLWPAWSDLVAESSPATLFGEQVSSAVGRGWLDAVCDDLEQQGYACGACVFPACCAGAPEIRERLYFVAERGVEHAGSGRHGASPQEVCAGRASSVVASRGAHWRGGEWQAGHDGISRWVKPGLRLLVDGAPARVGRLRAYGNAIVAEVAAEFIRAYESARSVEN